MMVPEDEWMLAAYAWIEDGLDGRWHIFITISVTKVHCVSYWWCDNTLGLKYTDVGSATDAQDYYDDMAMEYTKVVRAWGYNCPHVMVCED